MIDPQILMAVYEELVSQIDLLNLEYRARRNEILRPVADALSAAESEYEDAIAALDEKRQKLEQELKQSVVATTQSLRGQMFTIIYTKPRVSWNDKALTGYALNHPEILVFRKEGKPSASIRKVSR